MSSGQQSFGSLAKRGSGWAAQFIQSAGRQIVHQRKARKWSAQKLSDVCAELGMEFPRSTLADLENGRRAHLSIAELVVLAVALDVPPVWLLFGAGINATTEILPGKRVPADRAVQWFCGWSPFPGFPCLRCDDDPPEGFMCNNCGRSGGQNS